MTVQSLVVIEVQEPLGTRRVSGNGNINCRSGLLVNTYLTVLSETLQSSFTSTTSLSIKKLLSSDNIKPPYTISLYSLKIPTSKIYKPHLRYAMLLHTVGGYRQAMKMWYSILRVVLTLTLIEFCLTTLILPMADAINVTGLYDSGVVGSNATDANKIHAFVAPYHRNVTPGAVWVLPANRFDFGLGPIVCECIEANGKVTYRQDYETVTKKLTLETK